MTLGDSLDQILEWHRRNGTPAGRLLQPGLGQEEILRQLQAVPFRLPDEFVELYRWRNGTAAGEEGEDTSLFEIHRFLPLDEAIRNFQETYPEVKESYGPGDWLQAFQDVTSDGYGVRGGPQAGRHAPVVLVMEGEGVRTVFSSLTRMMQTVAAAFREGAMGWEDEEMETDFFAWGALAHRFDPQIEYWRDFLQGEG